MSFSKKIRSILSWLNFFQKKAVNNIISDRDRLMKAKDDVLVKIEEVKRHKASVIVSINNTNIEIDSIKANIEDLKLVIRTGEISEELQLQAAHRIAKHQAVINRREKTIGVLQERLKVINGVYDEQSEFIERLEEKIDEFNFAIESKDAFESMNDLNSKLNIDVDAIVKRANTDLSIEQEIKKINDSESALDTAVDKQKQGSTDADVKALLESIKSGK